MCRSHVDDESTPCIVCAVVDIRAWWGAVVVATPVIVIDSEFATESMKVDKRNLCDDDCLR